MPRSKIAASIRLLPEDIKRCHNQAKAVAAHYGTGDKIGAMPWTADLLTDAEFADWVASRKEAGRAIDIETCELGRWGAYDFDPYGLAARLGQLPEVMQQVGTNRFVRSPESRGWVCEDDLPPAKVSAMYARIEREWEAYARSHPDDPRVRAERGMRRQAHSSR